MAQARVAQASVIESSLPSLALIDEQGQAKTLSYGPKVFGDATQGLDSHLWGAFIDFDGRVFIARYNHGEGFSDWVERLTLIGAITSMSLAFDINGHPMLAYVREDRSFGVWYEVEPGLPQLVEVGQMPSRYSILAFSLTVSEPEFAEYGDALLMYGDGGDLVIRKASEDFQTEHTTPLSESYDRIWVAHYGRTRDKKFAIRLKG